MGPCVWPGDAGGLNTWWKRACWDREVIFKWAAGWSAIVLLFLSAVEVNPLERWSNPIPSLLWWQLIEASAAHRRDCFNPAIVWLCLRRLRRDFSVFSLETTDKYINSSLKRPLKSYRVRPQLWCAQQSTQRHWINYSLPGELERLCLARRMFLRSVFREQKTVSGGQETNTSPKHQSFVILHQQRKRDIWL